jgi:tetratricopeptide (TPR) repeat protein
MKQVLQTTTPNPSNSRSVPDSDHESSPAGFGFLIWLKRFALYLCAVVATCAIGLYFLWQIPILRDPSQLTRNVGDKLSSRPLAAALAPPAPSIQSQTELHLPTAPATTVPVRPPATGEAVATVSPAAPAPTTAGDPNEPLPLEPQANTLDDQTGPAPPLAETPAEDLPPPTPQSEIEQLLAEAQQQIDNRRLTAPASGNALRTYQRVLELQPNHPAALEGVQRIAIYYQDAAQQSLQQGRIDESLAYINRGLRAAPKDQVLLGLRREVRLAKQREQEQQQALLEMRRQQAEQEYQEQMRQREMESQQPSWWRQQPPYNDGGGFNQR